MPLIKKKLFAFKPIHTYSFIFYWNLLKWIPHRRYFMLHDKRENKQKWKIHLYNTGKAKNYNEFRGIGCRLVPPTRAYQAPKGGKITSEICMRQRWQTTHRWCLPLGSRNAFDIVEKGQYTRNDLKVKVLFERRGQVSLRKPGKKREGFLE